ncbi:MAG: hypothetical protein GC196_05745 [Hyphomonas sp.]|jgi:hypothetical protein|uniref:hypothetical protein n=1 Tax=Hyphomonas sp. TaxID=87 RepID=UPI0037BEBF7B|nr:hypothetical protein [Hyphomonas sp.]
MALVKMNSSADLRDRDRQSMIAYEALIYPVFLIVAMLGRLLPRSGSKARVRSSAFAEAAEQTQSVVPWFFVHR